MLPLQVNIASVVGLAGSVYLALRIARQGAMHVGRLWVVPAVTVWIAHSARRPLDSSPLGLGLMALGLAIGVLSGWRAARAAIVSIDVPDRRFVIQMSKSAILSVIALGAVTLLLTNLFYAQMLRLTNAGLLMGVGSVTAHRLYLFLAYLRERRRFEGPVGAVSGR
jgi:hypothetical protein